MGVGVQGMAKELVTDELWETIEPLLPPEPPKPQEGRPRVEDRAALSGIIFVLKSGLPGRCCPSRWAVAPELRAGGDYASGKRQAYGSVCTKRFWIVLAKPTR